MIQRDGKNLNLNHSKKRLKAVEVVTIARV